MTRHNKYYSNLFYPYTEIYQNKTSEKRVHAYVEYDDAKIMYILTPPTVYLNNETLLFTSSNTQINSNITQLYLASSMFDRGFEMANNEDNEIIYDD
mgnify:FL=1